MLEWLLGFVWLIPALPLASAALLAMFRLPRRAVAVVGAASVGLSAAVSLAVAARFALSPPAGGGLSLSLWGWLAAEDLAVPATLYLDGLSLVMAVVISLVGFLIHLYSTSYMAEEEGYRRFFALMNLFVASMLLLVLADSLLLLFLGWEGVGLCSYLLIGFWYRQEQARSAALKAFLVTRVGDTGMFVGLLLLATGLGTLGLQQITRQAPLVWAAGSAPAVAAAALLLAGAAGKSAQLPLQTWLPDAMAGPTPVSALIHAATMVTAGVYLIARTWAVFTLAPQVLMAMSVIGAATILLAGTSALVQRDLKRALAYSTMSQIGYMFLALGVQAWQPAIFHFATHAFFKALLFLSAGVVIHALGGEQDMLKMGGLWRRLPVTFWTFLVACLSMAALPPLTAGFFSKDWILYAVYESPRLGLGLWLAAIVGVMLTSAYTFRMLFLVFLGPPRFERPAGTRAHGAEPQGSHGEGGPAILIPLLVLAVPAALLGYVETPKFLGDIRLFSGFLGTALPGPLPGRVPVELFLLIPSDLAGLAGLGLAYLAWRRLGRSSGALVSGVRGFWQAGWGFDTLYDVLLVRPFLRLGRWARGDVVDRFYDLVAAVNRLLHRALSRWQGGLLRRYVLALALGAAVLLALVVML
jgi:NADH-quinone oxidoreductase subunit L